MAANGCCPSSAGNAANRMVGIDGGIGDIARIALDQVLKGLFGRDWHRFIGVSDLLRSCRGSRCCGGRDRQTGGNQIAACHLIVCKILAHNSVPFNEISGKLDLRLCKTDTEPSFIAPCLFTHVQAHDV